MIIATIGRDEYLLKDLQQAHTLLNILNDAKPVEKTYLINSSKYIFHETDSNLDIKIEIIKQQKILKLDEANQLIKQDRISRETA